MNARISSLYLTKRKQRPGLLEQYLCKGSKSTRSRLNKFYNFWIGAVVLEGTSQSRVTGARFAPCPPEPTSGICGLSCAVVELITME